MENRKARIIFSRAGGNASRNSYNCKVSIPKKWADAMGLSTTNRNVVLGFDGEEIVIRKDGDSDERQE